MPIQHNKNLDKPNQSNLQQESSYYKVNRNLLGDQNKNSDYQAKIQEQQSTIDKLQKELKHLNAGMRNLESENRNLTFHYLKNDNQAQQETKSTLMNKCTIKETTVVDKDKIIRQSIISNLTIFNTQQKNFISSPNYSHKRHESEINLEPDVQNNLPEKIAKVTPEEAVTLMKNQSGYII